MVSRDLSQRKAQKRVARRLCAEFKHFASPRAAK
jgi:hypothetical protein